MKKKINYKRMGLKAGLEIHQQLDTKHKLFCNCSTEMKEKEPIAIIKRKQHPVASELGEIDIATQYEYLRDRTFHYQTFSNETCLVETDEEPPHPLNKNALETALQIAMLLKCEIPNEIHIMRKTLIDGSAISGFQRTAVVGLNGFLRYKGKKIPIIHVSLEEDASAAVSEENGTATYRLNRLGVPLVEIGTGLLIGFSPEEIEDIAFNIGMFCRSTGRVKRGLGSIRQDVNVSIKKGERIEIKGVQELGILSDIIEKEIQRQLSLDEIRTILRKRRIRRITSRPINVNNLLSDTKSKLLRKILEKNGTIFAIKLNGFSELLKKELCPGKTLGKELADYVSAFGVKGIIHSDEDLMKYDALDDFRKLRELLRIDEQDAIVLIGEFKKKGKVANFLIEKINSLLAGPEKEVRGASSDGTTRHMRPLPGAARLYPESDLVPISVSKELIGDIKEQLPEPWTKKLARFKRKLKLSDDLAKQILRSDYLELFERIVKTKRAYASIIANTFTNIVKDLEKREKVKVGKLTEKHFVDLFDKIAKKRIVKEAIPEILRYLAKHPEENVVHTISSLNLKPIKLKKLKEIVKEVVANPNLTYEKAVGIVMSKVRGRIEAQVVMKTVRKFKKR